MFILPLSICAQEIIAEFMLFVHFSAVDRFSSQPDYRGNRLFRPDSVNNSKRAYRMPGAVLFFLTGSNVAATDCAPNH